MSPRTHEFLTFRKMITPALIQAMFWILIGIVALIGVGGVVTALVELFRGQVLAALGSVMLWLVWLAIVPVSIRIYCEIIMLFFRMNETLTEIKKQGERTT